MKPLIFVALVLAFSTVKSQGPVQHFAVWKPKDGQLGQFTSGYKKHLEWHKANNDTWSWYGWFVTSGPRVGHFVDATTDHSWKDFDNPVNPSGDLVDNLTNVFPYGEIQSLYKLIPVNDLNGTDSVTLKSKYLRFIKFDVTEITSTIKLLKSLKLKLANAGLKNFLVYQNLDGPLNELHIFIPFGSYVQLGIAQEIINLSGINDKKAAYAETWVFRPDLSLFGNN